MNRGEEIGRKPPIYCDNGPTLALAELDGAPLCAECLIRAIRVNDGRRSVAKISPLDLTTSLIKPPKKCEVPHGLVEDRLKTNH